MSEWDDFRSGGDVSEEVRMLRELHEKGSASIAEESTMSQDREQAIKDVADALAYTAKLGDDDALSCSMGYAALQRERVIALERALRDVRQSIIDGKPLGAVSLIDAALGDN